MTNHPAPRMSRARRVILIAILIAITIVLQRFLSFRTPILQVNFMFVPVMLAGTMLGWSGATFVATVADLIGAVLFPSGEFFFGYTLTAFLMGLVAGICLYRPSGVHLDKKFILRLIICILLITGVLNGGLNTVWVLMTVGDASKILVPVRIIKQLIMAPIMFATIVAVVKIFGERINYLMDVKYD